MIAAGIFSLRGVDHLSLQATVIALSWNSPHCEQRMWWLQARTTKCSDYSGPCLVIITACMA